MSGSTRAGIVGHARSRTRPVSNDRPSACAVSRPSGGGGGAGGGPRRSRARGSSAPLARVHGAPPSAPLAGLGVLDGGAPGRRAPGDGGGGRMGRTTARRRLVRQPRFRVLTPGAGVQERPLHGRLSSSPPAPGGRPWTPWSGPRPHAFSRTWECDGGLFSPGEDARPGYPPPPTPRSWTPEVHPHAPRDASPPPSCARPLHRPPPSSSPPSPLIALVLDVATRVRRRRHPVTSAPALSPHLVA